MRSGLTTTCSGCWWLTVRPRSWPLTLCSRKGTVRTGSLRPRLSSGPWSGWVAADYAEAVANLELICEEAVTEDLEGNPVRLDAVGLEGARSYLKEHGFPGDEAAHVRIDRFFDDWKYPDEETDEQGLSSSPRDRPRARTTADENSGDAVREGRCAGRRASCVSVRARGTRPV